MNIEQIQNLELELIEAIKSSDIDFLHEVLHDDLLFLAPNGQVVTKQMDLASHRAGEMTVEQLIPSVEKINIVDDMAVVVIVYDTRGTMLGQPIAGKFRYLRVWKICNGRPQVVGGSCVAIG